MPRRSAWRSNVDRVGGRRRTHDVHTGVANAAMRTPPRLLVVDDNAVNVDLLRTRLTANGYEVLTAADGEEALAVAREHHPDLILLDVMMPKMDGIAVCRALKADPSLPFMPVIMVTAKAETRDVVAGLEA